MAKTRKSKSRKNKKTKKGGMMGQAAAMMGQAAAMVNSNNENNLGLFNPLHAEAQAQSLDARIDASIVPDYNRTPVNRRLPPVRGRTILGQGSSKLVWKIEGNDDYAYINSTPALMRESGYTKAKMRQDYRDALQLFELQGPFGMFFPRVLRVKETPTRTKFIYKKELCHQIDARTMIVDTLVDIIRATKALMETLRLFTFDLKPANVGISHGGFIQFIDFGKENSFKLVENAEEPTRNLYVSFSILILLIYCYNNSPLIPTEDLLRLARDHITITQISHFRQFFRDYARIRGGIISENPRRYAPPTQNGYNPYTDVNIDNTFTEPLEIDDIVEPFLFIEHYGRNRYRPEDDADEWNYIMRFLLRHLPGGLQQVDPLRPRPGI
jgi:hypothetical protein